MIKYFLRKFVYKNFSDENLDILIYFDLRWKVTKILAVATLLLFISSPFISYLVINAIEGDALKKEIVYAQISTTILFYVMLYGFATVFDKAIIVFVRLMTDKLYRITCTIHGNALRMEDFNLIQIRSPKLYQSLTLSNTRGYCYSICFNLLKYLKKGSIEFIAIKFIGNDRIDEKPYTLHVLYRNNGWVFDTYSCRQFPEKDFFLHWKSIRYKQFDFNDIKEMSETSFYNAMEKELKNWCQNNDCSFLD